MATNTFDFGTRNSAFSFNAQDKAHRVEFGENLASVTLTPAGWNPETGRYLNLGPQLPVDERIGALNAQLRLHFEFDLLDGPFHWYANTNPRKEGGALGWVNLSAFDLPANGSKETVRRYVINGQNYSVNLPTRTWYFDPADQQYHNEWKAGRQTRQLVDFDNVWAQVQSLGGSRLSFTRPQTNEKTGKSAGEILHHYLSLLAEGVKVTVAVTMGRERESLFNAGELVRDDRLQKKAAWLQRTLEVEGFEWAAAREKLIEDRILFSNTQKALASAQAAAPELWKTEQGREEVKAVLDARVNNGGEMGVTITLDGVKVDISKVQPGIYKVYAANGKLERPSVQVARFGGAALLRTWSRQGFKLETISNY